MATILEQVQQAQNPVFEALHAQTTSLVATMPPAKFRAETTFTQLEEKMSQECNCFDNPSADYRSVMRRPEFLVKLGSLTIRNPLHLTPEQDKAHIGNKIKRANKDATRAYKDARKANKAAKKARSKSDKIQAKAINTRRKIRAAENMTATAGRQISEADQAHVTAMKWATCVEREGLDVGANARGMLGRVQFAGQTSDFSDHQLTR